MGSSIKPIAEDTLPALPASEINITLKAPVQVILAKADSVVPKQFTSDAWPNYSQPSCDFRYKYRFFRSGLSLTCINSVIGVHLVGNYQVSGSRCICTLDKPVSPWVSGSCGFGNEKMRRVSINVSSELSFLPGYRLLTHSKAGRLDATDKCAVSLFSTDITQQVLDSIRASLVGFCTSLDETVAGMDFNAMIKPLTEKSYGKTAVANYGYATVNPTSIRIGQLNIIKDSFVISAGITCKPEIVSDSSTHNLSASLPPLLSAENKNGILLYLNAFYDYSFLTRLLNDSLRNRVFDVKGRTIVIKEVGIKSFGARQVEIKIDFAGSNKGRIYLHGTPVLDTAKQTLTIPDISYTLESGDLILKIAKSLFRSKIRKTISGNSYLDIAALVKTNMPVLNAALNRKLDNGVLSTGQVSAVKLVGLLAKKTGIQVQVYVAASLGLVYAGR